MKFNDFKLPPEFEVKEIKQKEKTIEEKLEIVLFWFIGMFIGSLIILIYCFIKYG